MKQMRNIVCSILCLGFASSTSAQQKADYDLAPLHYSTCKDTNTITRLQSAMDAHKLSLPGSTPNEILASLLKELNIPISSQMLIFSKTSLQRRLISPQNPRAVYYNRDFYVAYVPGGKIEIIACDDPSGPMFYEFDPAELPARRKFARKPVCIACHANQNTMNVPGLLARSVFTDKLGNPLLSKGSFLTTPASPISERWGGWYVTGTHGKSRHMGNQWEHDPAPGQNITDLSPYFDTGKYLTTTSDILAMMLMEHQIQVYNTLNAARVNFGRTIFLSQAINGGKYNSSTPAARKMLQDHVHAILKVLLFSHEARLPEDGITGSRKYEQAFTRAGLGSNGHSLRDLRLQKRLFKYRCSYMIHSKAFAQLPPEIKTPVLTQLHTLLTSTQPFAHLPALSSREKSRIHSILSHTHAGYREVAGE